MHWFFYLFPLLARAKKLSRLGSLALVRQPIAEKIDLVSHTALVGWLLNIKTVLFQTIQFSVSTVSMTKTVLFQTIQFSISTQFSSIWPIDRTLQVLSLWTRVDLGTMAMKDTPHSPKLQHYWKFTIRFFNVIFSTLVAGGGLTPLQRSSRCILQPQPTGQCSCWRGSVHTYIHTYIHTYNSFIKFSFLNNSKQVWSSDKDW